MADPLPTLTTKQQPNPLPGQNPLCSGSGGKRHNQRVCFGKNPVQLLHGKDQIKGRVLCPPGAAHTGDASSQGLQPPRGLCPDVPGSQQRHMAARNRPDGRKIRPLPPGQGLLVLRHPPQQHQQHHDDVLGNSGPVGPRGVGQQAVRPGPDFLRQIFLHSRKITAKPAELVRFFQQAGSRMAKEDLILLDFPRQHLLAVMERHGKPQPGRRLCDGPAVAAVHKPNANPDLSHGTSPLYISASTRSAVLSPSAAADRMPPA